MDDRLLKLKLNDVEKLHTKLKQRLEEKIKLNYDVSLTKNTISDFELMRNVLIGIDLGATNEQLKIFAEFARFDSVRKGNSTLQTFNNILSGVLRGSTELLDNFGISITELNGEIEILAAEKLNKTGTELTAVERRILSVDAATNIMNRRLSETGDIALKSSEKIDRMAARAENLKVKLGNALIELNDKATDVAETWLNSIGGLYKVLIDLVIDIDEAKIEEEVKKAKQTTQKTIGKKWQILADGSKIQVLPGGEELFNAINSSFGQIEERIKQLKEKRLTLKPSDIIDVRNIDTEISQLEKFINPEKK
ncbi:MAG: hypothetical protein IPK06_04365 [Ignavibacteriae bacterium]|nr:hypothetical protein [Ignavibacteriota bacterium]